MADSVSTVFKIIFPSFFLAFWKRCAFFVLLVAGFALLGCIEPEGDGEPYSSDSSRALQDKVLCSTVGIGLLDYVLEYASVSEASGKLRVEYLGKRFTCWAEENPLGARASCKIRMLDSQGKCARVYVNNTHCSLKETNC